MVGKGLPAPLLVCAGNKHKVQPLCVAGRGEGKGDGNKTRAVPLLEFQGSPRTPRVTQGAGGAPTRQTP